MNQLDPKRLMEIGTWFKPCQTLLTAVEFDLFTLLASQAMTAQQIQRELGLHERGVADFLDSLVALELLQRAGYGATAQYKATDETAYFLDSRSPAYIGGYFKMVRDRLYHFWADLPEALKTGKPQNELKHEGTSMFEELYRVPDRLEQFLTGMAGISRSNFQAFAEKFDFSGYKTVCDIGGAAADLSILLAGRHSHLSFVSCDLPVVKPIAQKNIESHGLAHRIAAVELDFFNDPIPKADMITMGMILHDWNLDKKMKLLRAAYQALPAGGVLVAIENIIDDERRENSFGLLMSLTMLIEFGDAFDFTGADFEQWCKEVGFSRTEVLPLRGPASAAIAYK
ncbi:MAG: acetylserotonin O-methyltransferase [Proteobacteria bacterium]|nr:acetylserotonin O-methyltransferase [Pseudomonadota bacterium]